LINLGMIVYFVFTLLIIVTIFFRKKPILIAALGIMAVGITEMNSIFGGIQVAFRGLLFTATDLLPIILLIGLVIAMTDMLKTTKSDQIITKPFLKIKNVFILYWVLGLSLWLLTLFLWPTPAVTLLGAIALPVIANTKIHPLGLASGFCIFGAIGLGGDYIIQGAPGLLAQASGADLEQIISASIPLVIGSGIVAASLGYWRLLRLNKREIVPPKITFQSKEINLEAKEKDDRDKSGSDKKSKIVAGIVVSAYALTIFWLLQSGLRGDNAAAATGGVSIAVLILGTVVFNYRTALNTFVQHIQNGLKVSMGVFAPIVVIAGFFLLGTQSGSEHILNRLGPGYLELLALHLSDLIYINKFTAAIIVIMAAVLGAMSGSGFSAIPLVGGVAAALGEVGGVPVVPLAVLGQVAAIWTDAMIIPWGFPAVVSAVTGTEAMKIGRQNILPWLAALIFVFIWTVI